MSPDLPPPDRYGVIGYPVSHSRSPFIHGVFARMTHQHLTYRLIEATPEAFAPTVRAFAEEGGRGLNVTLPHKQPAAQLVDELSERAEMAGAVNTIVVKKRGLVGDVTDGVGLVRDLTRNHGMRLERTSILVLGAGGASRGVLGALLEQKPALIEVANRDAVRGARLAARFRQLGDIRGGGFESIDQRVYDLVINATSASLHGIVPPINPGVLNKETICYDMAYARGETVFTRWAQSLGVERRIMGWGMLVEQAAESFFIWRGVRPDTAPVLEAIMTPPRERALRAG
jgi:shikimate dehydrogenase